MKCKSIFFLYLLLVGFSTFAQRLDTLKVMQYNLLNYRNTTPQCDAQSNDPADKDQALAQIVQYVQPDILAVNEMGANWLNPNKLLTNALAGSGINYDQAEFTNNSFSYLANMLFYNKDKLGLRDQDVIDEDVSGRNLVRVIDVYHLFVKDIDALALGDTIFIDVVVAHLKAGDGSSDKSDRADATEAVMDYLEDKATDHNYILCGDLNVKSSSEDSYQNLISHSDPDVRFYDPVSAPGAWSEKSIYANLHTQSTRTSSTSGGCFSGGGMDDRFDFILAGSEVINNRYRVKYIDKSYNVIGQDSRRFNNTIINPTNNSVPPEVAQALYDMSDHLPVTVDLQVGPAFVGMEESLNKPYVHVWQDQGAIHFRSRADLRTVCLLDQSGRSVFHVHLTDNEAEVNTRDLSRGIYTVLLELSNGAQIHRRVSVVHQ